MENEGGVAADLKRRLALAVRSIQWSYGIFWSISTRQPGVLEWGDGYYNGDIKTRKTIQSLDFDLDELGLRRSEQLRELYESLSTGGSSPQAKRPSAALSPEDLTDTEWYYMVCMSFVFDIGQGLPGRTLAMNRSMWICDAPSADSKVFTRSLLAKVSLDDIGSWLPFFSRGFVLNEVESGHDIIVLALQTVVCFPSQGGVVELGTTEQVQEDPSLIHLVRNSFLEILNPIASQRFAAHHGSEELQSVPIIGVLGDISPCSSSDVFEPATLPKGLYSVEGANAKASRGESLQHIDDDLSNCLNASDSVSEALLEHSPLLEDGESLEFSELVMLDDPTNNHYHNVLAAVSRASSRLIMGRHFQKCSRASSFSHWMKGEFSSSQITGSRTAQRLLKKILFEVPRMYERGMAASADSGHKNTILRQEVDDDFVVNHTLSERRRREKINERLAVLKSMIPLADKIDKVSALDETIEYVRELERRVEELESCRLVAEGGLRPKRKSLDQVGRTSSNCCPSERLESQKRKTSDTDGNETDFASSALTVRLNEGNVLIEMRCASREGLLLDIISITNNLQLETHSVRSSTVEGILSLTIFSKLMGTTAVSAAAIKRALERFVLRES
ncbi:hypothetical protein MLD38_039144 [Melastoma candidum]|uniref:Uncharacterized protein n=1 Tax=Melastoma candidum TaxID=119954 RepID=A0ACB9L219_9MYRT|nr:hypothetical protein MLD38_039144 [Melastoma candidum]